MLFKQAVGKINIVCIMDERLGQRTIRFLPLYGLVEKFEEVIQFHMIEINQTVDLFIVRCQDEERRYDFHTILTEQRKLGRVVSVDIDGDKMAIHCGAELSNLELVFQVRSGPSPLAAGKEQ